MTNTDTDIPGETSSTYTVTREDQGRAIKVGAPGLDVHAPTLTVISLVGGVQSSVIALMAGEGAFDQAALAAEFRLTGSATSARDTVWRDRGLDRYDRTIQMWSQ